MDKFRLWKGWDPKKGVDGRKKGEGSGGQKEDGWAKIWKKSEENLEKQADIHGFMHGKRMI